MASGSVGGTDLLPPRLSELKPSLRRHRSLGSSRQPPGREVRGELSGLPVKAIPLSRPLTVLGTALLRSGGSDAAPSTPSPRITLSARHERRRTQQGHRRALLRGGKVQAAGGRGPDFRSLFVKPTWHSPISHGVAEEALPKAKDPLLEPHGQDIGGHRSADAIDSTIDIRNPEDSAATKIGGAADGDGVELSNGASSALAPAPPSSLPNGVPRQDPSELLDGSHRSEAPVQESNGVLRADKTAPSQQKLEEPSTRSPGSVSVTGADPDSNTVAGSPPGTSTATSSRSMAVSYVLRLRTSTLPGGGIRDPNGGVQIAIIGESGEAISARVLPYVSSGVPTPAAAGGRSSITSGTPGSGGNKSASNGLLQDTAAPPAPGYLAPTANSAGSSTISTAITNTVFSSSGEACFQEGSQAVVCLQGPDVRPVAALWVAPLTDTWRLAEASLCVADTETLRNSSSGLGTALSSTDSGASLDDFTSTGADGFPASDSHTSQETVQGGSVLRSTQGTLQSASTDAYGAPTETDGDRALVSANDTSTSAGQGDADAALSAGGASTSAGGAPTSAGKEGVGNLYVFAPEEEELLGESGDALAVELRPLVRQRCTQGQLLGLLEGSDLLRKADTALEAQAEQLRRIAAQREGMEEYSRLKEWLLLSTSLLVVVGTAVAVQIGGESAGAFFAAGGLASLLFLLKIQRQVDSIPGSSELDRQLKQGKRAAAALDVIASDTPMLPSGARPEVGDQGIRISLGWFQIDGPILIRLITVGVCFGAAVFMFSHSQGAQSGPAVALTAGLPQVHPQEALAAFLGFCTHRVSIILAAFRRRT